MKYLKILHNINISKYGAYELEDPEGFKDDPSITLRVTEDSSETILVDFNKFINVLEYKVRRQI